MPPAACRVEERISAKVAAAAVLGRGAAGGTAGALLYDGVGAVGGRADDRLALHISLLTAGKQEITLLSSHPGGGGTAGLRAGKQNKVQHFSTKTRKCFLFSCLSLPAHFTLLVCCLPSVAILIEGPLVDTFLSHVLHQLLVPDLLPQVPEVARDDLQVVPGVPRQTNLWR